MHLLEKAGLWACFSAQTRGFCVTSCAEGTGMVERGAMGGSQGGGRGERWEGDERSLDDGGESSRSFPRRRRLRCCSSSSTLRRLRCSSLSSPLFFLPLSFFLSSLSLPLFSSFLQDARRLFTLGSKERRIKKPFHFSSSSSSSSSSRDSLSFRARSELRRPASRCCRCPGSFDRGPRGHL